MARKKLSEQIRQLSAAALEQVLQLLAPHVLQESTVVAPVLVVLKKVSMQVVHTLTLVQVLQLAVQAAHTLPTLSKNYPSVHEPQTPALLGRVAVGTKQVLQAQVAVQVCGFSEVG